MVWHFVFGILTLLSLLVSIYAVKMEVGDDLDKRTLAKIQSKNENKVKPDIQEGSSLSS